LKFLYENLESGIHHDYDVGAGIGPYPRVIDNFHVEHRSVRAYYINRRGQQQQKVNLTTDDSIWFIVEFEDGSKDITTARITSDGVHFSGPVE
jgi:hypothetical protein